MFSPDKGKKTKTKKTCRISHTELLTHTADLFTEYNIVGVDPVMMERNTFSRYDTLHGTQPINVSLEMLLAYGHLHYCCS